MTPISGVHMCGILGIAVQAGHTPSVDRAGLERLRDCLAHRGPDDAGVADLGHVLLGHRRLAILDLTSAGHQPMAWSPASEGVTTAAAASSWLPAAGIGSASLHDSTGRYTLIYNGELYNDPELRAELVKVGVSFQSTCDAETVLMALATWGLPALHRFRGMFALAFFDRVRNKLLLARDPLGIKPLFYWQGKVNGQQELVFASEIVGILAHPHVAKRPDLASLSGYLTTIRVTMGERTLWDGIRTVRAGEVLSFDLATPELRCTRSMIRFEAPGVHSECTSGLASRVRAELIESITRHLRSDAELGLLLSGGLDSSIIATVTARALAGNHKPLRTYAATHADIALPPGEDAAHAERMARLIGSDHATVAISRERFLRDWPGTVARIRMPLSTPNEIAIAAIAERMQADGLRVALSGEGADELFAGYEPPLRLAAQFEATHPSDAKRARFTIDSISWLGIDAKASVFNPAFWRGIEEDAALIATAETELQAAQREATDENPMQLHLMMQRRVNLHGLLLRLDACTMRHGIEGRTPFADAAVAAMARELPFAALFDPTRAEAPVTKLVVRDAFASDIPVEILRRPKASFPLPFEQWIGDPGLMDRVRASGLVREIFTPPAIEAIASRPRELWSLAWPVINLALWDEF